MAVFGEKVAGLGEKVEGVVRQFSGLTPENGGTYGEKRHLIVADT